MPMITRQSHDAYATSARLRYAAYIKSAAVVGAIVSIAPSRPHDMRVSTVLSFTVNTFREYCAVVRLSLE